MDKPNEKNPLLDYGEDLTALAREGKLDEVYEREEELVRAIQVLSRRKKNNLLLLGNPGGGKTSMAELIAQRIVSKKVCHTLQDKIIFRLDVPSIVAGTQYRGQMEGRLKTIIEYLRINKNIILWIDEIHTIMETSSSNTLSMANIFKPNLADGTLQVIGATTQDEARKHFEKDAAMARRFQFLTIEDPTPETTVKILTNGKTKYEEYHNVHFPSEIIEDIPFLAKRYLVDRHLPDSAFDILDEVGARISMLSMETPPVITDLEAELKVLGDKRKVLIRDKNWEECIILKEAIKDLNKEIEAEMEKWEKSRAKSSKTIVTKKDVLQTISLQSKIPLDDLSINGQERITKLRNSFDSKLIGQEEAKDKVLKALRRSVIGLSNEKQPVATFLFLGTTGTGKTELAKVLAESWYNGSMVRLDMSEFMNKFSSTQLTGAPPGYVGYEQAGKFEFIRRNPYSLVLLDEIEKADKDVLNTLLQIFDNGELTDSQGRKINFRNTIIIMTSNLGARETGIKTVGFGAGANKLQDKSVEVAKKFFTPEIWNRINEVVVFEQLSKEQITNILDIELNNLAKMLKENRDLTLKVPTSVKEYLIMKGYSDTYGARFLKRTVQQEIVDVISEYLLMNEKIRRKSVLKVELVNGVIVVNPKDETTSTTTDDSSVSTPESETESEPII